MKNSNDTIWNRTLDLPACSAVPQPTAPPRAPEEFWPETNLPPPFRIYLCNSGDITQLVLAPRKWRTDPKKKRLVNKCKFIPVSPMGTSGELEVFVHEFLTSARSVGECSASRHGRFVPEKMPKVTIEQEPGWSPTASMDALVKRISCPLLPGFEPIFLCYRNQINK